MINFAQITAVPDSTLKSAVILSIALLASVAALVGIWSQLKKKAVDIQPQPLVVKPQPPQFEAQFCTAQHGDITRRLNGHDAEIEQIWNTFRAEDQAIRRDMQMSFERIARSLGRIEGRLGTKAESTL